MAKKQAAPAKRRTEDSEIVQQPGDVVQMLGADPDELLVANVGREILTFVKGLADFFTTAKAMEVEALATLDQAKKLTQPKTKEEDEQVQLFIRSTSQQKRAVEEHWKITTLVNRFHRAMTTRRAKAVDALEIANGQANNLHNAYIKAEQRRVAEEQERVRREAEERARLDREAEVARMEAEAVRREEASADLSDREVMFLTYYISGPYMGNAQKCAQLAGYKDPLAQGARLVSSAKIQKAIKAKREAEEIRRQADAVREAPLDVQVETVQPEVSRSVGGVSRTTHGAELVDEQALVNAILAKTPGIPTDLLRIDRVALNAYGRDLKEKINLWPGVKHVSKTSLVG